MTRLAKAGSTTHNKFAPKQPSDFQFTKRQRARSLVPSLLARNRNNNVKNLQKSDKNRGLNFFIACLGYWPAAVSFFCTRVNVRPSGLRVGGWGGLVGRDAVALTARGKLYRGGWAGRLSSTGTRNLRTPACMRPALARAPTFDPSSPSLHPEAFFTRSHPMWLFSWNSKGDFLK